MIDPDGGRNGGTAASPENNPNASNVIRAPSPTGGPGAGTPRGVHRKRVQGTGEAAAASRRNSSPKAGAAAVPHPRGGNAGDGDDGGEGNGDANNKDGGGIVTPELLVDALSGHEDGLLAIAERLMERYDDGYDAMGEAIIDAFADVQKLFQHAVEAAHMEGAAFEASRAREAAERDGDGDGGHASTGDDDEGDGEADGGEGGATGEGGTSQQQQNATAAVPRVEEFVDQDVKDVLREAVKNGAPHKSAGRHMDCYELYERACSSSSSLLPVDSDHRGRLQLAIARAENLSPDRACAILRYAMDDVLRSGSGKAPVASELDDDTAKRGDCVLKRRPASGEEGDADVAAQSGEEKLDSLVEEMKEVLSAPVYERSPIQPVARRFWEALTEARKSKARVAEGLEHKLGKIKGDFLLEKAEWEEKLTEASARYELYKEKYEKLLEEHQNGSAIDKERLMHMARDKVNIARDNLGQLRGYAAQNQQSQQENSIGIVQEDETVRSENSNNFAFIPPKSPGDRSRTSPSVVSTASSFAQHARSMVGSITNCGKYGANGSGVPGSGRIQNRKSVSSASSGEPSFR